MATITLLKAWFGDLWWVLPAVIGALAFFISGYKFGRITEKDKSFQRDYRL